MWLSKTRFSITGRLYERQGIMERSLDAMLKRLKDTNDFLDLFIKDTQITVTPENLSEFLVRGIMASVCNQAAILTYLLEKEGYEGLSGDVAVTKPEE
jgi:hypothetical protein